MSDLPKWLALGGVAIALLGPMLARVGLRGIYCLAVSVSGALVGAAGAAALLFTGGPPTMAIVGLVPLAVFAMFSWGHRDLPVMNDITTDLAEPPRFVAAGELGTNVGRDMAYPPGNPDLQRAHYETVQPLRTKAVPEVVWSHAKQAAEDFGWEVHAVDDAARTLEAFEISGQFRFRDDVVLRLRVVDGVTILDARAKARDGRTDFGENARRILDFMQAVRVRLPAELIL